MMQKVKFLSIGGLVGVFCIAGQTLAQTGPETWDWNPSLSPDGSHIVFNSDRNGNDDDIYLFNIETRELTHLHESPDTHDRFPTWSPDGEWIIYQAGDVETGEMSIRRIRRDGTDAHLVFDSYGSDNGPVYSPDGQLIAFASQIENEDQHIFVINADGTNPRNITINAGLEGEDGEFGFAIMPNWSPDGQRLAFSYGDMETLITDIWTIGLDGQDLFRVTDTPNTIEMGASYSPDGSWIAASRGIGLYDQYVLTIHSPDGTRSGRLDSSTEYHARPSWTSDSNGLVYHNIIRSGAVITLFDLERNKAINYCIPGSWEEDIFRVCADN